MTISINELDFLNIIIIDVIKIIFKSIRNILKRYILNYYRALLIILKS